MSTAPQTRKPVRLATAETQRVIYSHTPEFGATPETVKDPAYWVHVAKSLRPGDRIEVTAVDQSWYLDVMVRQATRDEVSLVVVHECHFDSADVLSPNNNGLSVKWRGNGKWGVVRDADGKTLKSGFANESDAHSWLENRVKAEAA